MQSHSPEELAVSTVTEYELLTGVLLSRQGKRERTKVERFLELIRVLPFDRRAAAATAQVRAELKKAGTPIGPYDLMIAGHARALGLPLVTGNVNEFFRVRNLDVLDWRQRS